MYAQEFLHLLLLLSVFQSYVVVPRISHACNFTCYTGFLIHTVVKKKKDYVVHRNCYWCLPTNVVSFCWHLPTTGGSFCWCLTTNGGNSADVSQPTMVDSADVSQPTVAISSGVT